MFRSSLPDRGATGERVAIDADRLHWELEEFRRRGLPAVVAMTTSERTTINTKVVVDDKSVPLRVEMPRDFPDVRPMFYGNAGLLQRHQHPQGGNLCVAGELDWWPWMSVAEVVDVDIRELVTVSRRSPETVRTIEADMPEPLSALFRYDRHTLVLVPDPFWALTSGQMLGRLELETVPGRPDVLLAIRADGIGAIDTDLRQRVTRGRGTRRHAYWVQLDPPPMPSLDDIIGRARQTHKQFDARLDALQRSAAKTSVWIGVRFEEEGPRRDERRLGWVFAQAALERRRQPIFSLYAAQALTIGERQRRIPELQGLQWARVVLVGAGSVGASVALELTRATAGVVDIYDNDFYDVNNSVRHVLPISDTGLAKAAAIAQQCSKLNPFARITPHVATVGAQSDEELAAMRASIEAAAVVIDTTGVPSVSRVLQRQAASAGVPLITASLTAGGFGGELLISRAGGPCRDCLALAQRDGVVPVPIAATESNVTPVGCSDPAFIGAGFEASELAAVVARTAAGLIPQSAYPRADFDWMILNFRTRESRLLGRLEVHHDCRRH